MRYLTDIAASTYLESTRLQFVCSNLSWTHFLDRMMALKAMTKPNSYENTHACRIILTDAPEWGDEDIEWSDDTEHDCEGAQSPVCKPVEENGHSETDVSDDDDYCYFHTTMHGLADWEFHQNDKDPFPSIPHGHNKIDKITKLDPYLGWIYRRTKQTARVKKKQIISLWNDDEFRRFVFQCIKCYMVVAPSWHVWRVKNPKRLPRKR